MPAPRSRKILLALVLAAALLVVVALAAAGAFTRVEQHYKKPVRPSRAVSATRHGDVAHATARSFARSTHPRVADTWGEIRAREFVTGSFQQYGFSPRCQEFITERAGHAIHSANIVAVKQGLTSEQLVVGAHYDSAPRGQGYVDNATGVGLLLEIAARVKTVATPYTVVFVAFGAEEAGALGSRYFVDAMTGVERAATIGMIDLDAVAGGEELSVTSLVGSPTWLRDDALSLASELGISLGSSPQGDGRRAGVTTVHGDALPFARAGIATAAFAAADWNAAGEDGGVTAAGDAMTWRGRNDTVARVEKAHPGRVRAQLADLSRLLDTLLTSKLERRP